MLQYLENQTLFDSCYTVILDILKVQKMENYNKKWSVTFSKAWNVHEKSSIDLRKKTQIKSNKIK